LNAVATYLAGEAASPESVPVGDPEPPATTG